MTVKLCCDAYLRVSFTSAFRRSSLHRSTLRTYNRGHVGQKKDKENTSVQGNSLGRIISLYETSLKINRLPLRRSTALAFVRILAGCINVPLIFNTV